MHSLSISLEFAYCVLVDFTSSCTEISELLMLFRVKKATSLNKMALNKLTDVVMQWHKSIY